MHKARLATRRTLLHNRLQERDPALINLPVPIPSIPILNPIVTPLIAGKPEVHVSTPAPNPPPTTAPAQQQPQPTPTPTPSPPPPAQQQPEPQPQQPPPSQPDPQPQPQPESPSSSPPSGQSGSGSQQQPPPDGGSGGQSGGGSTDTGGGGSSNPSGGGGSSSPPSEGGSPQPPPDSEQSSSDPSSDAESSVPTTTVIGADGKPTPVSAQDNSKSFSHVSGSGDPVANAEGGPDGADGSSSASIGFSDPSETVSGSVPGHSGSPSHSSTPGGSSSGHSSGGGSPDDPNGPPEIGTSGEKSPDGGQHGTPTTAIAVGAVIGTLVLLLLLVCVCRRRSIAKRLSRRQLWSRTPTGYGSTSARNYPASFRSSFGTSFEHQPISPSPPPMMPSPHMMDTASFPVSFPPNAPTASSSPSVTIRNRDSADSNSIASGFTITGASDHTAILAPQVVILPTQRDIDPEAGRFNLMTPEPTSPMSAMSGQFSHGDAWFSSYPQRDARPDSAVYPSASARHTPDSLATTSEYKTAPESAADPFADPAESIDAHTTETYATADTTGLHFAPIETIRRPFVPTLDDEIRVEPGDTVRVVRRFDDGWAYAENRNSGLRGLFPIDCLRDADQDLPDFLAEKRLSGYAGTLAPVQPPSRSLSRMSSVKSRQVL